MKNKSLLLLVCCLLSLQTVFPCTMYKITKNGRTIVSNNEDWISSNSQFWFEPSTGNNLGVMYMGLLNNFAQGAINEAGLVFDGFANAYLPVAKTKGKSNTYIGDAIKHIMQRMQTVEEVETYLSTVNLSSLSSSQLVFVDKTGTYLIVEGDEFILGNETEKAFSNFYYSQISSEDEVEIDSYQNGKEFLKKSKGKSTIEYCREAMKAFSKEEAFGTQYSTIYDLDSLKVRVYLFHDFTEFVEINLKEELAKGSHHDMIASLFPHESKGHQHFSKYNNYKQPTLFLEELVEITKTKDEELQSSDFKSIINYIGNEWLKDFDNPQAAIKVFKYGITLFPKDSDLYDSLGEAYLNNDDWHNAILNYAKSLELNPENDNAINKLLIAKSKRKKFSEKSFKQLTEIVDGLANEILAKENVNSISLALYRNGKMYQNYYGTLDKDDNNKPNDSTLFEVASVTKVFLGSLVAKAVLEDKLALDDDIRNYLKGDYSNLEYEGTPITIRNLVTHTVGFDKPKQMKAVFNEMKKGVYQNKAFNYTIEDFLDEIKRVKLNSKPGTVYQYNEHGPELAAYILQEVYNQSYKSLLQQFLNDLGMKSTYLQDFDAHKSNLAVGYDEENEMAFHLKNPLLGGGYGMISTLPDLSKFLKFQLESTNPIIKESTKTLFKDNDGHMMGYLWQDMGFAEREGFYYSKDGDALGIKSGMLICPDSNYGQIVIVNNQSEEAKKDWQTLFSKIETELIMYPKINLYNLTKPTFIRNAEIGLAKFNLLKDKEEYYNTDLLWTLNMIGYDLLNIGNHKRAIEIFKFAIKQAPTNANLYDSLGEAYFIAKDYKNAIKNYKKSLKLNPKNDNAKNYITKINKLLRKK